MGTGLGEQADSGEQVPGADFGNQERNDFELVDGEGRQPGGQASH